MVTDADNKEIGDGDGAAIFEENSAKIERLLFGYIGEAMVDAAGRYDKAPEGNL